MVHLHSEAKVCHLQQGTVVTSCCVALRMRESGKVLRCQPVVCVQTCTWWSGWHQECMHGVKFGSPTAFLGRQWGLAPMPSCHTCHRDHTCEPAGAMCQVTGIKRVSLLQPMCQVTGITRVRLLEPRCKVLWVKVRDLWCFFHMGWHRRVL